MTTYELLLSDEGKSEGPPIKVCTIAYGTLDEYKALPKKGLVLFVECNKPQDYIAGAIQQTLRGQRQASLIVAALKPSLNK